jgi:crotonobetainyl-CoA:carnitine CoA-transferase CaiB-like acyl-CoA transferase
MTVGLEGVKVIEMAQVAAGPMAGRLMADWGADVIHIEHPVRGDIYRSQSAGHRGGRAIVSDINYNIENYNRSKKSLTLDMSHEAGKQVLYKLLETADVFLNNLRPREITKFELEYETLSKINPKLVVANVSGFGKKGPYKDIPGYEYTGYFARSGIHHVLRPPGGSPIQNPIGFGDNVVGLSLAYGIMTALFIRERTGVGQEVDVSLYNTGVYAISGDISGSLVSGQDRHTIDRKEVNNVLVNAYETKDDRWIQFGMAQPDPYWSRFCKAIGREDLETDPRFASFQARVDNRSELFDILVDVFHGKILEEWTGLLDNANIPWGPIQTLPEVTHDPQARENNFYVAYDHPNYGKIEGVANPVKLSKTPMVARPAPEFSQHTEEVLLESGFTWEQISEFKGMGVIA